VLQRLHGIRCQRICTLNCKILLFPTGKGREEVKKARARCNRLQWFTAFRCAYSPAGSGLMQGRHLHVTVSKRVLGGPSLVLARLVCTCTAHSLQSQTDSCILRSYHQGVTAIYAYVCAASYLCMCHTSTVVRSCPSERSVWRNAIPNHTTATTFHVVQLSAERTLTAGHA